VPHQKTPEVQIKSVSYGAYHISA